MWPHHLHREGRRRVTCHSRVWPTQTRCKTWPLALWWGARCRRSLTSAHASRRRSNGLGKRPWPQSRSATGGRSSRLRTRSLDRHNHSLPPSGVDTSEGPTVQVAVFRSVGVCSVFSCIHKVAAEPSPVRILLEAFFGTSLQCAMTRAVLSLYTNLSRALEMAHCNCNISVPYLTMHACHTFCMCQEFMCMSMSSCLCLMLPVFCTSCCMPCSRA